MGVKNLRAGVLSLLLAVLGAASPAVGAAHAPVDVEAAPLELAPGGAAEVNVLVLLPSGYHANANPAAYDYLIPLSVEPEPVEGLSFESPRYPQGVPFEVAGTGRLSVYEGEVPVRFLVRATPDLKPGRYEVPLSVRYQLCDARACYRPGSTAAVLEVRVTGAVPPPSSSVASTEASASRAQGGGVDFAALFERGGLWLVLAAAFLGGVLLNFTPCIYPILPVTVGYFGASKHGRAAPIAYGAGLAGSYAVLGLFAAAGGAVLGAWLQTPAVVWFVVVVLVAMALASLGAFEVRMPPALADVGRKAERLGPVALGATAGVVAAPCVGPLVAGFWVFLAAQAEPFLSFLAFFAMGLGMALPQVLLAYGVERFLRLPEAGAWTAWTKKAMGLLLFGGAIWVATPLLGPTRALALGAIWALVSAAYVGWFARAEGGAKFRWVRRGVGVAYGLLGVRLLFLLHEPLSPPAFEPFAVERIGAGQPVMVDVRADWCPPCLDLERYTFSAPEVRSRLTSDWRLLVLDITRPPSPAHERWLDAHGVVGVPTVLFFDPRGNEVEDARLLGYEAAGPFLKRLSRARARFAP